MFSSNSVAAAASAVGALVVVKLYNYIRESRKKPLPPGPKPLPIIGNLLDVPKEQPWDVYSDWKRKYGDVAYINVFGQHIIVLNSRKVVEELLDKRSASYSDRPTFVMGGDLCKFDNVITLVRYSNKLRDMRKLVHHSLGAGVVHQFDRVQEKRCSMFLRRFLKSDKSLEADLRWYISGIVLEVTYDHQVAEQDDPYVKQIEEIMVYFSLAMMPGKWLVDVFPVLKHMPSWLPGAGFKRLAKFWGDTVRNTLTTAYTGVKTGVLDGTARPSILSNALRSKEYEALTQDEETEMIWTAGAIYGGASDTTVGAILAFVLAMVQNPDVQRRAQKELDEKVGPRRLPSFGDRKSLPYIEALLKEVLRWAPVVPLGVPHANLQEDEYEGMRIPKGSTIITNIWGLCHDPELYPEPNKFRPERHLEADVLSPRNVVFGNGRRICPGIHLSDTTLYLTVVQMLHVFNISAIDEKNIPEFIPWTGLITRPLPFECRVTPRSDARSALLLDAENQ